MTSKAFGNEIPVIPHLARSNEVGDLRRDVDNAFTKVETVIADPTAPKVKFTSEGGLAIKLVNKTGADTVKGTLVDAHAVVDDAFDISSSDSAYVIGIVYEGGVSDGDDAWVVVGGIAEVLLKDTTAATRGNWVRSSDVVGRADATAGSPPGLTAAHFQEIGHCIQNATAGTDVLARCVIHFN